MHFPKNIQTKPVMIMCAIWFDSLTNEISFKTVPF